MDPPIEPTDSPQQPIQLSSAEEVELQELETQISSLRGKINIEQMCLEGAENLRRNLTDPHAVEQCELNIHESQKRLDFLFGEMCRLQERRRAINKKPIEQDVLYYNQDDNGTSALSSFPNNDMGGSLNNLSDSPRKVAGRSDTAGSGPRRILTTGSNRSSTSIAPRKLSRRTSSNIFGSIMASLGLGRSMSELSASHTTSSRNIARPPSSANIAEYIPDDTLSMLHKNPQNNFGIDLINVWKPRFINFCLHSHFLIIH